MRNHLRLWSITRAPYAPTPIPNTAKQSDGGIAHDTSSRITQRDLPRLPRSELGRRTRLCCTATASGGGSIERTATRIPDCLH
jgi:hypothetical protein